MTALSFAILYAGKCLAWIAIIFGCFVTAFSLAEAYMVIVGGVVPGTAMFMGEPAPTPASAIVSVLIGSAFALAGMAVEHFVGRRLGAMRSARRAS